MSDRMPEIDRRKFVTGVGATLAVAKAGLAVELLAQNLPTPATTVQSWIKSGKEILRSRQVQQSLATLATNLPQWASRLLPA